MNITEKVEKKIKKLPAIVITSFAGEDLILAQITSKSVSNDYSINNETSKMQFMSFQ